MDGSGAQRPQEGRAGIILQGGPGSLIFSVAEELAEQHPTEYEVVGGRGWRNPEGRVRVVIFTVEETELRVFAERSEWRWFLVRVWRPRDQVEGGLWRRVEEGLRSEQWFRDRMAEWDRVQAGSSGVEVDLHLNLGEGQHTPSSAAEAVHLGFQRFLDGHSSD